MVKCPQCGETNVHASRASVAEKLVLLMVLQKRVRCYDCMHRFMTLIFHKVKPRVSRATLAAQKKADANREASEQQPADESARGASNPEALPPEIPEPERSKEEAS